MNSFNVFVLTISTLTFFSCSSIEENENKETEVVSENQPVEEEVVEDQDPYEMLNQAYQKFKEGNDEGSIKIANEVLEIGRETNNDTLIGGALVSLCRNAQRSLDTVRLAELSEQLAALSEKTGDQRWMMKRAHMNAEMWRLVGNMEKAEAFYNESMKISSSIGATGMFTIDHFNKSFVSTATGDFYEANRLISKYYDLLYERDSVYEDAYGLIALAYLLEQEKNYKGAHEVATVTRRLFKDQNIFPEPPDEKPLLAVEEKVKEELSSEEYNKIKTNSTELTVKKLLDKYLLKQ